jgi:hypothetical protein
MYSPAFTQDPRRIARLQRNFEEGRARERLTETERRTLDTEALTVDQAKLDALFARAKQAVALRKSGHHKQ